jgi:hypothetical protein
VALATHPHLAPTLKKSRAVFLCPLWVLMACSLVKFAFHTLPDSIGYLSSALLNTSHAFFRRELSVILNLSDLIQCSPLSVHYWLALATGTQNIDYPTCSSRPTLEHHGTVLRTAWEIYFHVVIPTGNSTGIHGTVQQKTLYQLTSRTYAFDKRDRLKI